MMTTLAEQQMADALRLDSPVHTVVSSDTVETRGKRALALLGGSPCFTNDHSLAGALRSATDKIDARVLWGREIESLTIGETLALYIEVFERVAHDDYMADRITHRQYSTRVTRLRNKIVG